MKRIMLIWSLIFFALAAGEDVYFRSVLNSRGCDSLGVVVIADTLRIDTNCDYRADKAVTADTSRPIFTQPFVSFWESYWMTWSENTADTTDTIAPDADSMVVRQETQCWDSGLRRWLNPHEWSGLSAVDTVWSIDYGESGYAAKEMNFSKCDSVRFVLKTVSLTTDRDTIKVVKRRLRVEK